MKDLMYSNDSETLDTHLNNYFANFSFKDFFAKLRVNLTDYSLMQFHIFATLTSRSKPASGSGLSLIKVKPRFSINFCLI